MNSIETVEPTFWVDFLRISPDTFAAVFLSLANTMSPDVSLNI